MDALVRIKRLVLAQRVIFTAKAESEMYVDDLSHEVVFEAIINAPPSPRHSVLDILGQLGARHCT
jgi:hypothetical protein